MAQAHRGALGDGGAATFVVGGQIGDVPPDILLVYPEGNYIRASDDRPFLQIGESKYGKFLLDVAVLTEGDLVTSTKIALSSMMSTARANLSVGPPYDAGVYRTGTFTSTSTGSRPTRRSSASCGMSGSAPSWTPSRGFRTCRCRSSARRSSRARASAHRAHGAALRPYPGSHPSR